MLCSPPMTEEEKKKIRRQALLDYHEAVDVYKASCGQVSQIMELLKKIVMAHTRDQLGLGVLQGSKKGFVAVPASEVLEIPSHEEIVAAVEGCMEAREQEERMYVAVKEAGGDVSTLHRPSRKSSDRFPHLFRSRQ